MPRPSVAATIPKPLDPRPRTSWLNGSPSTKRAAPPNRAPVMPNTGIRIRGWVATYRMPSAKSDIASRRLHPPASRSVIVVRSGRARRIIRVAEIMNVAESNTKALVHAPSGTIVAKTVQMIPARGIVP
jgi:hypothetical protein